MASSPPYNRPNMPTISQPYAPNSPVSQPLKRRQSDMATSAPQAKRRKQSMLSVTSSSSHPLRQTSFPPESSDQDLRFSRSPSPGSASLVSGASGTKSRRGRKQKGRADDDSLAGAKSAVSGGSGKGRRGTRELSLEEDEDEDTGGGDTAVARVARTDEEAQKENEQKAMLLEAFDSEQFDRFEGWRASKLADSVVRRIVNQTLSQSAPQSVILAVRSVAKIFIGEMIEGGRRVQTQWQECDEESKNALPTPPAEVGGKVLRGPLLPDHLREAHRRHKLSSENSLAGQMGLWQAQSSSGVERFGPRVGGKRLFK